MGEREEDCPLSVSFDRRVLTLNPAPTGASFLFTQIPTNQRSYIDMDCTMILAVRANKAKAVCAQCFLQHIDSNLNGCWDGGVQLLPQFFFIFLFDFYPAFSFNTLKAGYNISNNTS